MGKSLISQKRGKGGQNYRVPLSGKRYKPSYLNEKGKIIDILHDKGRNAPIIEILYSSGKAHMIAPRGIKVGDIADNIGIKLRDIPESMPIFGLETYPNSGPKLCMAPGTSAVITSKGENECIVQLPSRAKKTFHPDCRATIGVPAGEGRGEKPWTKAGKKWMAIHKRGKLYPITSAKAMNAVNHPFGGGYGGGVGRPKTVSRNAPPGRKVGSIAARRTGRRKK